MFSRAIAIIAPGIFLSQPPIAKTPSILCPLQTVSIESAITSLDTREYFIPSVPIEIPSLIVIVPNTCGMAPASLALAIARKARSFNPILQGVIVLYPLAIPTIGLVKSPSPKPTARSIARLGARCTPPVTAWLLKFSGILKFPLSVICCLVVCCLFFFAAGCLRIQCREFYPIFDFLRSVDICQAFYPLAAQHCPESRAKILQILQRGGLIPWLSGMMW